MCTIAIINLESCALNVLMLCFQYFRTIFNKFCLFVELQYLRLKEGLGFKGKPKGKVTLLISVL